MSKQKPQYKHPPNRRRTWREGQRRSRAKSKAAAGNVAEPIVARISGPPKATVRPIGLTQINRSRKGSTDASTNESTGASTKASTGLSAFLSPEASTARSTRSWRRLLPAWTWKAAPGKPAAVEPPKPAAVTPPKPTIVAPRTEDAASVKKPQALSTSVATAIVSAIPAALIVGMVMAEYAILLPTMKYLRPDSLGKFGSWTFGEILAAMLPASEVALGFRRDLLLKAERDAKIILMLMFAIAAAQVAIALLSPHAVVHTETVTVVSQAPVTEQPTQCKQEEMPATVNNSYRIDAWNRGAVQRDAAYQTCVDKEREARKTTRTTDQKTLLRAVKDHPWWEKYLLAALAGIVSMVIVVCSGTVADLVHALAAIPGGIGRALFGRRSAGDAS